MLKVLEREIYWQLSMLQRPVVAYNRKRNWPAKEATSASVRNSGLGNEQYLRNDLGVFQNPVQTNAFIDIQKSKGNYVVDADGNTLLDTCSTDINPIGYNHDLFKNIVNYSYFSHNDFDSGIVNPCASDSVSSATLGAKVKSTLGAVAPQGMEGITLVGTMNGSAAAVKHAMLERESENGFSALYFNGSTHGSALTLGGMICGWPKANYPASASEESQILESVRNTLAERSNSGTPVAAIVIEPTQQSSGYVASDTFMDGLRSITGDFEAALIVDETSTGCGASGKGFWQYNGSADYVVFGKRTQASGFFSKSESLSLGGCENDVSLFGVIHQAMQQDNLVDQVAGLSADVASHAQKLNGFKSVRTSGTSVWVDCDSLETTKRLVAHLRANGVLVQQNGGQGIIARPALIAGHSQISELFSALGRFN